MILLIDNYDSFVYNLYQLIGSITPDLKVIRNDACTVEEIEAMHPESIVISPGPGRPEDAGNILEVIRHFTGKTPILGVCLGHQAICKALGGVVTYAKELMHGKTSEIYTEADSTLFCGLESPVRVAIRPSRVAAHLAITKGRPVQACLTKASLSCRASSRHTPIVVSTPLAFRNSAPPAKMTLPS